MSSPAGDIQGVYSSFEGLALFYPGENITFGFENGTSDDLIWLAFYSDSIVDNPPSISSGQDLYNYFVLGQYGSNTTSASTSNGTSASTSSIDVTSSVPTTAASISAVSTTDSASSPTTDASATPSSWDYSPYPTNPAAAQPNLGDLNGGVITGYFLNDGVTAVLSIPSFSVTSEAVLSFSTTIGEFIKQSKAAGLTRFIIDLQRNDGGSDLLATDAFKQVRDSYIFERVVQTNGICSSFHQLTHTAVIVSVLILTLMRSGTLSQPSTTLNPWTINSISKCQATYGLHPSTSTLPPVKILHRGQNSTGPTRIMEIFLQLQQVARL